MCGRSSILNSPIKTWCWRMWCVKLASAGRLQRPEELHIVVREGGAGKSRNSSITAGMFVGGVYVTARNVLLANVLLTSAEYCGEYT